MALLPRQRKQQGVYKGIKSQVLSRWKKALSRSGYDLKKLRSSDNKSSGLAPSGLSFRFRGCQRRRPQFHFARRSQWLKSVSKNI